MKKDEFYEWFVEQVKGRWPTWQVGSCDLEDWYFAFGGVDKGLLNKALRRHSIYDDPSRPSTKRLLELIRPLQPKPRPKKEPPPGKYITFRQFQENIPNMPKEKRIRIMASYARFKPDAKRFDPEAWQWAVERGLIDENAKPKKGPLADVAVKIATGG